MSPPQRFLILFLTLVAFVWTMAIPAALAAEPTGLVTPTTTSAVLFEVHCAGCHPNGGNIIRRGKTLKSKALERYGYAGTPEIAALIRQGKGNMSAFADRLSSREIDQLADYVLSQAQQGWP